MRDDRPPITDSVRKLRVNTDIKEMTPMHPIPALSSTETCIGRVGRVPAASFAVTRRAGVAATLLASAFVASAFGQDPSAKPADAPAGDPLRAVFIDVSGKVQWRANETAPWQDANVNDVVAPGVEVRTGLRSHAALRVGRNATALLDAGTLFQLPSIAQDGETLRTSAAVKHGRADFKVDKVGLSNDFKVVTPSTTLAVRGTEFAVASGALKQVEVLGARRNAINAIELKYALNNNAVQLSGGAASSSTVQHPANAGAEQASPPATTATQIPSTSQGEKERSAGAGPSPVQAGGSAEQSRRSRRTVVTQKARGTAGGANSVQARAEQEIEAANQKIDQSIQYLLQAQDAESVVVAQRDALEALKDLATVRRDDARAALARHEAALSTAIEIGQDADAAVGSFDVHASDVAARLADFDAQRERAAAATESLRAILEGTLSQSGSGEFDRLSLADELLASLLAMGDAHAEAVDGRGEMAGDRDAVIAAVATLDGGARRQATAALADYERAVAALSAAVESGEADVDIAAAARDTVSRLQGLISAIAGSKSPAAVKQAAQQGLVRLLSANQALSHAVASLDASRAARDSALDDSRAKHLGEVESIYAGLVEARARLVADWSATSADVDLAQVRLTAAYEAGTGTFGRLTSSAKDDVLAVSNGARSAIDSLADMASKSTELAGAFDGAQGAAGAAEAAFASATSFRVEAELQESAAHAGLARTQGALESGDLPAASDQSALTTFAAAASRGAAVSAAGQADVAKSESLRAEEFKRASDRLTPDVERYGANRPDFIAAANARRDAIDGAAAAASNLSSEVKFFDDVAQNLSSRAGTGTAAAAAASSADARTLALAAAAQLASAAVQAHTMAETASTNAGRVFGRSMSQYVARAQAAAAGAEGQAILAGAAATRAEGSADAARTLVSGANGQVASARGSSR